jgi:hypothetical protein
MIADMQKISVVFGREPYTLIPVPGFRYLRDAPKSWGVYLWCIDYHGAYLVNYVGKTWDQNGFWARNRSQLAYWRNGNCQCADIEAFKRGRRKIVPFSQEQLAIELRELEPLYRILLATVEKPDILSVENEVTHRLQSDPATYQFLCNKTPYPYDSTVEILPQLNPRIIGLTVPIPDLLRQETDCPMNADVSRL